MIQRERRRRPERFPDLSLKDPTGGAEIGMICAPPGSRRRIGGRSRRIQSNDPTGTEKAARKVPRPLAQRPNRRRRDRNDLRASWIEAADWRSLSTHSIK